MKVWKRRFIVFIVVAVLLTCVRFADNGLLRFIREGEYTAFTARDAEIKYDLLPLINNRGGYERIDLAGDESKANTLLESMRAVTLSVEHVDDTIVIYAHSPLLSVSADTQMGKVNVMIAVRDGNITVGSPLIKGSF